MHFFKNTSFGLFNGLLTVLVFSKLIQLLLDLLQKKSIGFLNIFVVPYYLKIILGILLLDLWMYIWHLSNHSFKILWIFHRMHHSDNEMDATSAVRFHAGEILISSILRLPVYLIIGLTSEIIMIYEILFNASTIFIHSNINLPEKIDRIIRTVFVSPNMHRIHHSDIKIETDSNYTNFLSIWDRIFRTFKKRDDTSKIILGLKEFQDQKRLSVLGMITTPFIKIK